MSLPFTKYSFYSIFSICTEKLSWLYTIITNFILIFSHTLGFKPPVVERPVIFFLYIYLWLEILRENLGRHAMFTLGRHAMFTLGRHAMFTLGTHVFSERILFGIKKFKMK